MKTTPALAFAAIEAEELWQRGVLPLAGGWMQQTRSGTDAVRYVRVQRVKLGDEQK